MPTLYQTKRYALMVFSALGVIGGVGYAALASEQMDEEMQQFLISCAFIAIPFNLCGLVGAWRENYFLTSTYTGLEIMGTIGIFIIAFTYTPLWPVFGVELLYCALPISFLLDLRSVRREREAGGDSA